MSEQQSFLSMLEREFSRYLLNHDEVAGRIPANCLIVFQVEGEREFNRWHRELSLRHREPSQPLVEIHIRSLRQDSLIEKLDLVAA